VARSSTPSAVTTWPRLRASSIVATTMASVFDESMLLTKDLSILISDTESRLRRDREE